MTTEVHPDFRRHYKKRVAPHPRLISKTKQRIAMFQKDPRNPTLKDHALTGKKCHLRAFSVTGDIRIVYKPTSKNTVLFLDIGTHNQVY